MHIDGPCFKDESGRTLLLRGVNLGGSSKVPYTPNGATYIREGFFDHRNVSFVGRPFPLEEADEHFARLRRWGLTFLRFLVTWEAVEHTAPGVYDQEYLDYLHAVVAKAAQHGIRLFIDPHQDMWSRFSGGDGAPGWTFEAVGMDVTRFQPTGAAFLHPVHGDPLPRMIWPTNATKLAAATLFTLFFAGDDFAPQTKIEGEPAQEFLQRHYIEAIQQIAMRLKDLPNVVGYDTLNEPLRGYIGWRDLTRPHAVVELGAIPSPFQSMLLGAGIPQEVDVWERRLTGPKRIERRLMNPDGQRLWLDGCDCIWRTNGVWDLDSDGQPRLLRPDHFSQVGGRPVDFNRDYYIPFNNCFAKAIRDVHPGAMIFVEKEFELAPPDWGPGSAGNVVYAPHWYDGFVLFTKTFSRFLGSDNLNNTLLVGPGRIRRAYKQELAAFKEHAAQKMGDVPTLIGEMGIAFDLDDKRAYRTGDFRTQAAAMDRTLRAMDDNLLSYTLWNYTADNTNARGDLWNDEDLSIFSRDQQDEPENIHSGGRALQAIVRPYALATAGQPLRMSFDIRSRVFEFVFRHDPKVTEPSLIFVPDYQYPQGYRVEVTDGSYEARPEEQILAYRHSTEQETHVIRVKPM